MIAGLLLPLDPLEAYVVRGALVMFATSREAADMGEADRADAVTDRLRELIPLATKDAEEWLRDIGIGQAKGRRQG